MVAGVVTLIPILYIPSVAVNVFYQAPISWEWGLVLGACVIFIFCSEIYKACIRPHIVRWVKRGRVKREIILLEAGTSIWNKGTDFTL